MTQTVAGKVVCVLVVVLLAMPAPAVHALAPESRIDEIHLRTAIEDIKRSLDQSEHVLRGKLEALLAAPGWSEVFEDFLLFLQRSRPNTDPAIAALASIVGDGNERAVALRNRLLGLISTQSAAQVTVRTILFNGGIRLFDPEDTEEIAARQFVRSRRTLFRRIKPYPYSGLTQQYGYKPWKTMHDALKGKTKDLFTALEVFSIYNYYNYRDELSSYWPDLVALGKAAGGNALALFQHGLPAVCRAFGKELSRYWPDLVALGMTAGKEAPALFLHGFPAVREAFGKELSNYWPGLVALGKAAGEQAPVLFRYGLPAVHGVFRTPEDLQRVGGDLVELGKAAGKDAPYLFQHGLPAVREAFGKELSAYWPGLVVLGKLWGNHAPSLFQRTLFALRVSFEENLGEELSAYWPGLVALGKAAGEQAPTLFQHGLPIVLRGFGKKLSAYWPTLVALGKAAGEQAPTLFQHGLPVMRGSFRTPKDLQRIGGDLVELGKAAGKDAPDLFQRDLPAVREAFGTDFLRAWPKVQRALVDLLGHTTDYNRARILELLLRKEYLLWLSRRANLLAHMAYYTEVLSREPRLGYQILEGITEGLEMGAVQIALPAEERAAIFAFVDNLHSFNPFLFAVYKQDGDRALAALIAFAGKILTDEVGAADMAAFKQDYDRRGFDGGGVLASAIQIAIPSSGASFVKRAEIRGLLERFIGQGDLRSHIPEQLRGKDFGGGRADAIRFSAWHLATGKEFDPAGRIGGMLDALRFRDQRLSEDAVKQAKDQDRKELEKLLGKYLKGEIGRQEVLMRFYAYAAHSDQLGEKIDRIIPDEYQGLNMLEQLFLDKDNLSILFEEVIEKVFKDDPQGVPQISTVVEGQKVARGMIKQIEGLWKSGLAAEEKLARLATMIARTTLEQVNTELIPNLSDGLLISAIQQIAGHPDRSRPQRPIELIEELFAEPIGWVQAEKEKFEERVTDREVVLEFRVVKGIPYGLWGLCAGVCIATDIHLWKKPQFMLLAMIDKQSGKAVGFVHLFETEVEGKRVLTVPGIEPSVEFISEVKAREAFPLIERALVKVAEEGGYEAMYLPQNTNILSNRNEIVREARRRYRNNEVELDSVVGWNTLPRPYPFTHVYEMWKREVPAVGPPRLGEELAEEGAVQRHL